jgi:hypothetical protein
VTVEQAQSAYHQARKAAQEAFDRVATPAIMDRARAIAAANDAHAQAVKPAREAYEQAIYAALRERDAAIKAAMQ